MLTPDAVTMMTSRIRRSGQIVSGPNGWRDAGAAVVCLATGLVTINRVPKNMSIAQQVSANEGEATLISTPASSGPPRYSDSSQTASSA